MSQKIIRFMSDEQKLLRGHRNRNLSVKSPSLLSWFTRRITAFYNNDETETLIDSFWCLKRQLSGKKEFDAWGGRKTDVVIYIESIKEIPTAGSPKATWL